MRVAKSGSRREKSVAHSKAKKRDTSIKPEFSQILQVEQVGQIDLLQALDEIDEYARRLKESPVLENLLRYKKRVSSILQFLVQQSYNVTENSFYDPQGRRRLLMIVENIDQKLEQLTREFLNKQTDSLELISRLDEIRGLLLDLYT